MLWTLAAAAILLLVVSCANVASLTLVRIDSRQRELAVREALGAGRARIMRYYFAESALLAGSAGLIGLVAAWTAVRALVANSQSGIPRLAEIGVDSRAALFALILSALAAVACSVIPTLRMGRGGLALREARGGTGGRSQHRVRGVLVASQIALSVVSLAGSGLLLRSFERLHSVRPGFDPEHVVSFWVSLPKARYQRDPDVVRFYSTLLDRAGQLPGVTSAALTSRLPLVARGVNQNPLYPEGAAAYDTKLPPLQLFTSIGGDYFRTMRISLRSGRLFGPMDTQREDEAIISSRTAELFWSDSTGVAALGERFRALPNGPLFTVIGVVGNARDTTLAAPPSPTVYFPELVQDDSVTRQTRRTMALVVRVTGEPTTIVPSIQGVMRELDPTLPVFDVRSMAATMRASMARQAFIILILGGAAAVTLMLGAVGLYGLMAYVVTLRRRELGIRLALGATPSTIVAATTRQGVVLTVAGAVGGLLLFVPSARFLRALLFGVQPWDAVAMSSAVLLLLAFGTLASWIPARRAGRTDPAETLRAE
jgi:predicted permease